MKFFSSLNCVHRKWELTWLISFNTRKSEIRASSISFVRTWYRRTSSGVDWTFFIQYGTLPRFLLSLAGPQLGSLVALPIVSSCLKCFAIISHKWTGWFEFTFDVLSDSQESSVRSCESKKLELKLEFDASISSLFSSFIWAEKMECKFWLIFDHKCHKEWRAWIIWLTFAHGSTCCFGIVLSVFVDKFTGFNVSLFS